MYNINVLVYRVGFFKLSCLFVQLVGVFVQLVPRVEVHAAEHAVVLVAVGEVYGL